MEVILSLSVSHLHSYLRYSTVSSSSRRPPTHLFCWLSHNENAFRWLDMEVFLDNFATDDVLFAGQGIECDFDVARICGGEEDGVEDGGYEAKLQSKYLE